MDKYTALSIVEEFQRWRRSEPPYDGDTPETHQGFPFSARSLGEAFDVIIAFCKKQFEGKSDAEKSD